MNQSYSSRVAFSILQGLWCTLMGTLATTNRAAQQQHPFFSWGGGAWDRWGSSRYHEHGRSSLPGGLRVPDEVLGTQTRWHFTFLYLAVAKKLKMCKIITPFRPIGSRICRSPASSSNLLFRDSAQNLIFTPVITKIYHTKSVSLALILLLLYNLFYFDDVIVWLIQT